MVPTLYSDSTRSAPAARREPRSRRAASALAYAYALALALLSGGESAGQLPGVELPGLDPNVTCLNERADFADGSYSGWQANMPDDVVVEGKEGRDQVLALKADGAEVSTTVSVEPGRNYKLRMEVFGENDPAKATRVSFRWFDAEGGLLQEDVASERVYRKRWQNAVFSGAAPVRAVTAEVVVHQVAGQVWIDQTCVYLVGQGGTAQGGIDPGGTGSSQTGLVGVCRFANESFDFGFAGWTRDPAANAVYEVKKNKVRYHTAYVEQTVPLDYGLAHQLSVKLKSDTRTEITVTYDDDSVERLIYAGHTRGDKQTVSFYLGPNPGADSVRVRITATTDRWVELHRACLEPVIVVPNDCGLINPLFARAQTGWIATGETDFGIFKDRQAVAIGQAGRVQQGVDVAGGAEYELEYLAYGSGEDGDDFVEITWHGANGFRVTESIGALNYPEEWRAYTHTVTAPPEATRATVRFRSREDDWFIDDVCWGSTAASAEGCANLNGEFDYGTAGYTNGGNTAFGVNASGPDAHLDVDGGWFATRSFTVLGGEEYYLTYELNQLRNGSLLWNSFKWYDANNDLIREEPITTVDYGTGAWNDHEYRVIAPSNAVRAVVVWSLNGGHVLIDGVCIANGATRAVGCESDGQTISAWERADPADGGAFGEAFVDGVDAYRLDQSEVFHEFAVTPGQNYRTRFLFRGAADPASPTRLWLTWHRADGSFISETVFAEASYPAEWQELVFRGIAPAGAAMARMSVANYGAEVSFALYCSMDAGVAGRSSVIAGLVWADNTGDGVRAAGEPQLGGVKLQLYRDDGDGVRNPALDTFVTEQISTAAGDGYYFTDLTAGDYYVLGYLLPTKRVSAFRVGFPDDDCDFEAKSYDGIAVGFTPIYSLNGDDDANDVDFGQKNSGKAAVSGYAWSDVDNNRFRNEPNALGLNGIKVYTYSVSTGQKLGETTTQDDPFGNPGYYLFNYITVEPVYIEIDVPAGTWLQSRQSDNKFDPADARSLVIALAPDRTFTNVSAGYRTSGTEICDNGVDDDGDGRVDDRDSDCTSCVVAEDVVCGEDLRYYVPPVLQMHDPTETTYSGPSYLIISTASPEANVTVRRGDGSVVGTVAVTSANAVTVALDENIAQTPNHNSVENNRGLLVESDYPISVLYTIQGSYNKALVTIKGRQALGNRFRAGSQVQQYDDCAPGGGNIAGVVNSIIREAHFVSAMATEDATTVTFEWDATRLTLAGGITSPHTVTLNRGQSYLVRDAYTNETVSGLGISSDKAIAVLSGSQHTPICTELGSDAGIDQLVPECYAGTDYVLVKHEGVDRQHYGVVVAIADDTEVFVDGGAAPVATLDAGEWHQVRVTGSAGDPHYVTTSRAAYVYHVSGISANNEVGMGLASAVGDCRGSDYVTFPRGAADYDHQLNVVIATADLASLRLNGAAVSSDARVTTAPVPTRGDLTSLLVPSAMLTAQNVLEADSRFQAALLVGKNYDSGTYGYLTSFAQEIVVRDPVNGIPSPRYELDQVCGGDSFTHFVDAESCGSHLEIVEVTNDASSGSVTLLGGLGFRYDAKPDAYGPDDVALRIRDENGNEVAVCIELFVCGEAVPIYGLAPSQTIQCGGSVPASTPTVVDAQCPYIAPIVARDSIVPGGCPNEYTLIRTWSANTDCGGQIRAERVYYFVDNAAPTFSGVPPARTLCGDEVAPLVTPTATDACAGAITVTLDTTETVNAGSSARTVTRVWTATDECGNAATTSQVITYRAVPVVTTLRSGRDASCGQSNGTIRIEFAPEADYGAVQFSIEGAWQGAVPTGSGVAEYNGYPAGDYVIRARWSNLECPVDVGTVTIGTSGVTLSGLYFNDVDGGGGIAITNGSTYHVDDLPTRWNLGNDPSDAVGSMRFRISGAATDNRTDGAAPYRYPGDAATLNWRHGTFFVVVDAHEGLSGSGAVCASSAYSFSLIQAEICDNGIDDDGDGYVDCLDGECPGRAPVLRISQD